MRFTINNGENPVFLEITESAIQIHHVFSGVVLSHDEFEKIKKHIKEFQENRPTQEPETIDMFEGL